MCGLLVCSADVHSRVSCMLSNTPSVAATRHPSHDTVSADTTRSAGVMRPVTSACCDGSPSCLNNSCVGWCWSVLAQVATTGSMSTSSEDRKRLAKESLEWNLRSPVFLRMFGDLAVELKAVAAARARKEEEEARTRQRAHGHESGQPHQANQSQQQTTNTRVRVRRSLHSDSPAPPACFLRGDLICEQYLSVDLPPAASVAGARIPSLKIEYGLLGTRETIARCKNEKQIVSLLGSFLCRDCVKLICQYEPFC